MLTLKESRGLKIFPIQQKRGMGIFESVLKITSMMESGRARAGECKSYACRFCFVRNNSICFSASVLGVL